MKGYLFYTLINYCFPYFRTRNSNDFDVSVNVAAGEKVTFNLWYQEVLQRRVGHYEHIINIDPGQIVPDLKVEVHINESRPLTVVHVPPIRKEGAKDKEKESEYYNVIKSFKFCLLFNACMGTTFKPYTFTFLCSFEVFRVILYIYRENEL